MDMGMYVAKFNPGGYRIGQQPIPAATTGAVLGVDERAGRYRHEIRTYASLSTWPPLLSYVSADRQAEQQQCHCNKSRCTVDECEPQGVVER